MKRLLIAAILAASSLYAGYSQAAPARITAKPQDELGRPKDPVFTVSVNQDGTVATTATAGTANASSPTYTEGGAAPTSTDLHGSARVLNMDSSGVPLDFTSPAQVVQTTEYPFGAVPVNCSSGNVAAASAVCTLAAVSGKTNYLVGFRCGGAGATAAAVVNITVTGLVSSTETYTMAAVAGATLISNPVAREYAVPVPASSSNTAIVVTMPSLGAGNTNASCNAEGYYR